MSEGEELPAAPAPAAPPASDSDHQQHTSVIDDLFGAAPAAENDPFAQLGGDDEHDVFDKLGAQDDHDQSENSIAVAAETPEQHDEVDQQPPAVEQAHEGATQVEAAPAALDDKDFSDLLAEFEAEQEAPEEAQFAVQEEARAEPSSEVPAQSNEAVNEGAEETHPSAADPAALSLSQEPNQAPVAAAALFSDGAESSTFDDLLAQPETEAALPVPPSETASPSPVPSLSIEHSRIEDRAASGDNSNAAGDVSLQSMFSNASDWLGDTTVDDSFTISPDPAGHAEPEAHKEDDGNEPIPFEVPQGWYDDQGEWHWYTDEEKEQVRLTMLGQGGWEEPAGEHVEPEPPVAQSSAPAMPYSPALQTPAIMSENAARRTPQPEMQATLSNVSYDPYAPTSAQQSSTTTSSYGGLSASTYSSQPSPYAPYSTTSSTSSAYAPSKSHDPYTPAPYAQAAPSPYAPTSQAAGYLPQAGPSSQPVPAAAPKPAPPKIQRMASNAYDPPFLRPQKSFVRPPAAISAASPAYGAAPMMSMSPPLPSTATPPPPPAGPPRMKKTDDRPASRGPSFAPPPPRGPARAPSVPVHALSEDQDYGAPVRPPSAATSRRSLDPHDAYSPPQPQPPNRFISQDSNHSQNPYAAPPRPSSAIARDSFAPPPQRTASPSLAPPPAARSPYGPPRPLSRGPPKRQPSPFFEAPPPRPDIVQRRRSPPQQYTPSVEQVLSPPQAHSEALHTEERSSSPDFQRHNDGLGITNHDGNGYDPSMRGPNSSASQYAPEPSPRRQEFPALSRRYDEEGEEMEDSYAPQSEDRYPSEQDRQFDHDDYHSQNGYRPPSVSAASPPARQQPMPDPYAPSSLGLVSLDRSHGDEPTGYQPYAPYAPAQNKADAGRGDPYAPTSQRGAPDVYAPKQASPEKARPPPSQPPRAPQSSYEPSPYSPTVSKSINMPPPADPYARAASPAYSSSYGVSPPQNNYFQSMHQDPSDDTYVPQQVLEQKPVSEDPLGRCTLAARNAPLAVFGFGGVLVTAFPGSAESDDFHKGHSRGPSYGYGSGRGQLWIRSVSEVAAPTALKGDQAAFPGPLVFDPSTPKGAAGEKKKREAVLAYLDARADEIEKGLPYLKSSASRARRDEEGRLVLVRLLKALIIGEGKLSGSPQVEEAVQIALANPASPSATTAPMGSAASMSAEAHNFPSSLYPSASSTATPVKASPAQLNHLSWLLLHGNKRDAASYAAEQGLWSHALVISSNVDPELWREIVGRFSQAELGGAGEGAGSIKAAYTLFSGASASTVDDLTAAACITDDPSKDQWREVVSAVLHNGKPADLSCLDELGHKFMALNLATAAQVCFILSPASPFLDVTPAAFDRPLNLLHNPRDEEAVIYAEIAEYARSLVPAAKGQETSYAALPQLLPYKLLRAWRLAELGEVEQAQRYCSAVDASSKLIKNGPSLLAAAYAASLEDLLERLTGSPSINPPNAFGTGRKAAKPGLDKLGSWIEGRLTKFIAGEEDAAAPPKTKATTASGKPQGPFAQFSSISPNPSGSITRNASTADFGGAAPNGYLGVQSVSRVASPVAPITSAFGNASSSAASSYADQYGSHFGSDAAGGGFAPWGSNGARGASDQDEQKPAPSNTYSGSQDGYQLYSPDQTGGEFINPMAQLSLNDEPEQDSYTPPASQPQQRQRQYEDDDEDDLGFGNAALSRNRTPKPGETTSASASSGNGADKQDAKSAQASKDAKKADSAPPGKPEHKASWLGKWWGKKEGEVPGHGGGPVKANLGEESSMVFDPELKRWVVRGAKADVTPTSTTPPPPRAQTVSPSRAARPDPSSRAMSATPPPSSRPPPAGLSMTGGPPRAPGGPGGPAAGFAEGPDGGIRRMKSSLAESVTAADVAPPPGPGGAGGPPTRPPTASGPPPPGGSKPATPSIDDLLSRPPSKRPASAAARKGARNRYVDVFQPGAEGQ